MATSGSIDETRTAGDVITRAYRRIRRIGQSASVPGELSTTALSELNSYVKFLRNKGVLLSSLFTDSFSIVADTASYTLDPRVLSISAVRYTPTGGNDRELFMESRERYLLIPNKASSGDPSLVYFDRQRGSSVLYIWQVPSTASGTIKYSGERIIEDLDTTTDNFDINREHLMAIEWNLAALLLPEFGAVGTADGAFIIAKAAELEMDMLMAERPEFVEFVPEFE